MSSDLNPALPTTIGALLTEEVAMNPSTFLPSFFEMMLMEEAHKSAYQTVKDLMSSTIRSLSTSRPPFSSVFLQKIRDRLEHVIKFCLLRYGPEIRLLLFYTIQKRSLASNSSTLSESLYGARRCRLNPITRELLPLRRIDHTRIALVTALAWYVDEKLEALYGKYRSRSRQQGFCRIFCFCYPYLFATQQGLVLLYQVLYLLDKTSYFHPASHLVGTIVRRLTQADTSSSNETSDTKGQQGARMKTWVPILQKSLIWAFSSGLLTGWLWQWRQLVLRNKEQSSIHSIIPPPPHAPPFRRDPKQRIRIPRSGNNSNNNKSCPLCQQPWIAPTAVLTSGFVYCLKCISLHIRSSPTCPLTGSSCQEEHLVRIYEPSVS